MPTDMNAVNDQALSHGTTKLTTEQIKNISKALGQIIGDEDGNADGVVVTQNEKGEILNEENLPIVEISEPLTLDADFGEGTPGASLMQDQTNVLPLWALSSAELHRRRVERDRILDLLEEEEEIEWQNEERREEEEGHNALQKRREAAKRELDSLKAARDLQKKMGRALLRNMVETREKEEAQKSGQLIQDAEAERETLKPRKSVSFALPAEGSGEPKERLKPIGSEAEFGWGDFAPPRVQTATTSSSRPMKTGVVERFPLPIQSCGAFSREADSDDESLSRSPSASSDEDVELLPEEFDLDTAQHQREIALRYYEKRNIMGTQAAATLTSHNHDPNGDPWDQPEVSLEASVAGPRPKPSVSRFKSNRSVSTSTSLESSVSPVSQASIVQRAIRTGKVEGDNLIGDDEGNSDEEDMKAIMALLKQGEVTNVGPAGVSSYSPSQALQQAQSASQDPGGFKARGKPRIVTSKFKMARKGVFDSTSSSTRETNTSHANGSSASEIAGQSIPISSTTSQANSLISRSEPESTSTREATPHPGASRPSRKVPVSDTVMERMPAQPVSSSDGRPIPIPTASSRVQGRVVQADDSAQT